MDVEITRRRLINDLQKLADRKYIVGPLYDPVTNYFSPEGWLAHLAGRKRPWLKGLTRLYGSNLSITAKYYGIPWDVFDRLCWLIRRTTHMKQAKSRVLEVTIKTIEEFDFKPVRESKKLWHSSRVLELVS